MSFPKLEKTAFRLCRGSVLDAGAGAGSHSLYLLKKGLDVTALDISEASVEVMRSRGIKKAICADLYDFYPTEKFDTILMMMNGIGIAGDLDGLRKLLAHLKELIKPDGQIIFDSSDISYVNAASRAASNIHLPDPDYYGTIYYQLAHKSLLGEMYTWLFVDSKTMNRFAREAGFKMELIYQADEQYLATLKIAR
jgi:2-polyprenyl-3-methyl-5-hydroxy-6-metoxy-1,4-benzoquinol methylase